MGIVAFNQSEILSVSQMNFLKIGEKMKNLKDELFIGLLIGVLSAFVLAVFWGFLSLYYPVPQILELGISHWWNCLLVIPLTLTEMIVFWETKYSAKSLVVCPVLAFLIGGLDLMLAPLTGLLLFVFILCYANACCEEPESSVPDCGLPQKLSLFC